MKVRAFRATLNDVRFGHLGGCWSTKDLLENTKLKRLLQTKLSWDGFMIILKDAPNKHTYQLEDLYIFWKLWAHENISQKRLIATSSFPHASSNLVHISVFHTKQMNPVRKWMAALVGV